MKRFLPYTAIITAMLIWSVSGIAIKEALAVLPPLTLIVYRFSIAVVVMCLVGWIAARWTCRHKDAGQTSAFASGIALQKVERKDLPFFLLGGLFQPFLYYILETFTYKALSSPTIAEALLSTSPVFAPLFGLIFLREKLTVANLVGVVVSTAGMLMLILAGTGSFALGNAWGLLTAFLAVSAVLFYSVILKRIPEKYNALTMVFYMQAFALALFFIVWLITNPVTVPLTSRVVVCVLYLALCSSVLAFILFCYTVRQIGVTRANVFNNLRPVFTALAMFLVFDEHLPWGKLAGIALIIIGLYISHINR